jgi:hypothetical protein
MNSERNVEPHLKMARELEHEWNFCLLHDLGNAEDADLWFLLKILRPEAVGPARTPPVGRDLSRAPTRVAIVLALPGRPPACFNAAFDVSASKVARWRADFDEPD